MAQAAGAEELADLQDAYYYRQDFVRSRPSSPAPTRATGPNVVRDIMTDSMRTAFAQLHPMAVPLECSRSSQARRTSAKPIRHAR